MEQKTNDTNEKCLVLSRRQMLRYGAFAGATVFCYRGSSWAQLIPPCGTNCDDEILPEPTNCGIQEVWATTPFIVNPFIDPLPQPQALRPGFLQRPGVSLDPWTVRKWTENGNCSAPGATRVLNPSLLAECMQDSYGGMHSVTPADVNAGLKEGLRPIDGTGRFPLDTAPLLYHIRLQVGAHSFTSSPVRPIDKNGNPVPIEELPFGVQVGANGLATLPLSTVYGFNGTFPGPMINADYGKPVIVRLECDLDFPISNDLLAKLAVTNEGIARGDFGVPQFLCHLHNGHTSPESDGNPHYMQHNEGGYIGGDYCDNLYLNWPAGGDPNEMQSFLWYHDHRMHHTGANVYKGMVGLFPMYDPGVDDPSSPTGFLAGTGLDPGDETWNRENGGPGLGLPGRRVDHADGTFDVKYDIPMALYDCRLDDGVTPHADFRIGDVLINGDTPMNPPAPIDETLCGATHPEQWGKTFFRYHPNHGFTGDLFTVNGVAFPKLDVFQRRYRFRFLGATIARCYEVALMTSAAGPQERPGTDGQWQIPDGQVWRNTSQGLPRSFTQIASMGGLLPNPIFRDSFQIWPATRAEVVVDFTGVQPGTVLYITNIMEMDDGRKPDLNPPGADLNGLRYKVPMVKIIVGGPPPAGEPDESRLLTEADILRPAPELPSPAELAILPHRVFSLSRSGKFGDEAQWLINDLPFDPTQSLTEIPGPGNPNNMGNPRLGSGEVWTVVNGSGGWTHPMHMHQEEHHVLRRENSEILHPEDTGKADTVNLDPGESVTFFRRFRTFPGQYVAHCHNLAHEDHSMMFGFKIDPAIVAPPLDFKPRANQDHFFMRTNTTGLIPVLANDTTADGKPLGLVDAINIVDFPSNAKEFSVSGNFISYTPATDFSGSDSLTYTISIGSHTSQQATVLIEVVPPTAPIANSDSFTMTQNTTAVIPVIANDTTYNGTPITPADIEQIVLVVNAPFNGRADHLLDHSGISYTPDPGFVGTDSFDYAIVVGGVKSMPAKVTIQVGPITHTLNVRRAMAWTRNPKIVERRGPRWLIMGTGAAPGAEVSIEAGGNVIKKVKANRRGGWRFFGRAVPGLANPTTITVSTPGAETQNIQLTVR